MPTNKHKSKRTSDKERRDYKSAILNSNQEVRQLLKLFGLSLVGDMEPQFGIGHLMELSTYQNDGTTQTNLDLPTLTNLCQHLGFVANQDYDEIRTLPIDDKWRNRLLERAEKNAKYDLGKYITKVRPLLSNKGIYLYTVPLTLKETVVGTGHIKDRKSMRVLCALPLSRQIAEDYKYSQEQIKNLAPLVAWLIPQLVNYKQVKNTDKLLAALDGWVALLEYQQREQLHTSILKHDCPVMSDRVTQRLLF